MSTSESIDLSDPPTRTSAESSRRFKVRSHLYESLSLLLQAHEYAIELNQDSWDLAVELPVLREAKLSNSDLRWLVGVGYVEHGLEITGPTDRMRQFRRTPLVNFSDATCLVLTPSGVAAARDACAAEPMLAQDQVAVNCRIMAPEANQETVLMAFEEDGWPPRIDDPLPPLPQLDPRRRLHDTIKALNRKQKSLLLRFMGDGSGEGIRWEFTTLVPVAPR
jgi:hypothetical protein